MMLEPKAPICAITWRLLPSPMASMTTTEATPMTMPSRVRAVRKRFTHITRQAARRASSSSPRQAPAGSSRRSSRRSRRRLAGSAPALPLGSWPSALSLRIWPSRTSMMRWARAATSRSWVMRITAWPWAESSSSSFITSMPLWLSRAPVGSSARITWPPFISARAMETRCCWPPDNWCGRLPARLSRPRRCSSSAARAARSGPGVPA